MARFNNGFIKIHRELLDSDIASRETRLSLFIHLIGMANVKGSTVDWNGGPRECPRGSLVTSFRELKERTGLSIMTLRRQLEYLRARGSIAFDSVKTGTFITILNYSKYQNYAPEDEAAGVLKEIHKREHSRNMRENIGENYIEEYKNIRIKKYIKHDSDDFFNDLMRIYPVQGGPKKAKQAYDALNLDQTQRCQLKQAVQNFADHFKRSNLAYTPFFHVWLGEWRDWVDRSMAGKLGANRGFALERQYDANALVKKISKGSSNDRQ